MAVTVKRRRYRQPSHLANPPTPEKQELFLKLISVMPLIERAAKETGIPRQRWYQLRREDEDFRKQWDEAYRAGIATLEDHALNRAMDKRKPSDILTIFMLKANDPSKYRENVSIEHTGAGGKPLPPPIMNVQFVTPEKKRVKK